MESKFRYILFPDNVYRLTFQDYSGNDFTVEVLGEDILNQIRRNYALDNFLESLDNPED